MIIITGASDGLGEELARLYKADGKKVVNVSRREVNVADVNIVADLANNTQRLDVVRQLQELDEPIELFISNAGVYSDGMSGSILYEDLHHTFEVNTFAPIVLVSGMMERFRQDETDIAFVVSTVATKASNEDIYGPSKWALRGFAQNIQSQFKGKKNRVSVIYPGGFTSRIFEKATGKAPFDDDARWMSPAQVAAVIKSQLDTPKNVEVSEVIISRK